MSAKDRECSVRCSGILLSLMVVLLCSSVLLPAFAFEHGNEFPTLAESQPDSTPSPSRQPLAQAEIPQPDNETWIDGPFELQYRVRMDEQAPPGVDFRSLPPLLHVDFRHLGARDMTVNMHHSCGSIFVNGVQYRRRDQQWGAGEFVPHGGAVLSIPFLLTPEWQEVEEGSTKQLEIRPGGRYLVVIQLEFLERFQEEVRPGVQHGSKWRTLTTRTRVIEPTVPVRNSEAVLQERLRRYLVTFPRFHAPVVQESLRKLVVENQPASGEYLLTQLGPGDDMSPDPASVIITNTWTSFQRKQLERYLAASMTHRVSRRMEYPHGIKSTVSAGPSFNNGYQGFSSKLPLQGKAKTITTHFVDGRQLGEPVVTEGHSSTSIQFPLHELVLGKHNLSLSTNYEFQVGSAKYSGKIETPNVEISIVPDAGDTLVAPFDPEIEQQIAQKLQFVDAISDSDFLKIRGSSQFNPQNDWGPYLHYGNGKTWRIPQWQLDQPVPLDLCFDVEFRVENSDARIPCGSLMVLKGETSRGHFSPISFREDPFQQHADANGNVAGRFVLTPSREQALSEPKVTKYFGGTLTSGLLGYRVKKPAPVPLEKDGLLFGQW